MTTTLLRDIIEPSIFADYITEQTIKKNRLVQSGIIVPDPIINALVAKGGRTIDMPFFKDLSGDAEVPESSTSTTTWELGIGGITTGQDRSVKLLRDKAFGAEDLSAELSGADPMMAIADQLVTYWLNQEQLWLLETLDGVFAANLASDSGDLINDISRSSGTSATDTNKISASALITTMSKLGDSYKNLTGIMMHSVPFFHLVNNYNVVEWDLLEGETGKVEIPRILGREIIVDDDCSVASAATSGNLYTTFLFGRGAIARGESPRRMAVEVGRKELSGQDFLINRRQLILHPRGVRWNDVSIAGVSPSNAELAEAQQWTRVYEKKNIRLAALITNG